MKCDMHVHCRGRDPEIIYSIATSRGMQAVTITDHNDISAALALTNIHPENTFTGVEFSTVLDLRYKFHILVYKINTQQFYSLNRLRSDMREFCKYVMDNGITHSFAHLFYSLKKQNALELRFNIVSMLSTFESVNGKKDQPGLVDFLNENGKKTTQGSDSHLLKGIGSVYTQLPDSFI